MNQIKLVIWDLDNTFWKGILSEEEITPIQNNIAIVRELVDLGVMNSICSKNDFNKAKNKLIELGIFDLFIFPKISYYSKGQQIQEIIQETKLRSENILFIDDSVENLKEAEIVNPKLNVSLPYILDTLLEADCINHGKKDLSHKRLQTYKLLEQKQRESKNYSNNFDFLKQSNIKLDICGDCTKEKERIFELIHRTNQLNFTKYRQELDSFEKMIADEMYECAYITVSDKYGDYGLVGFYSLDKKKKELIHFLFSCRTIGMGVEQYVYAKLNYPTLNVVGEVINNVDKSVAPEYINCNNSNVSKNTVVLNKQTLLRGGCDLMQLLPYIKNSDKYLKCEFNHLDFHRDHTYILRQIKELSEEQKKQLIENIYFYDSDCFETELFNSTYKYVCISVLMDYVQNVYHLKTQNNIKICYGDFDYPDIPVDKTNLWTSKEKEYWNNVESEGQITPNDFYNNLQFIRNNLPTETILVIINGAEVPSSDVNELKNNRHLVHKKYNSIIDQFIKNNSKNTKLLDVRKIVTDSSMLNDNIRHYKRAVYFSMAKELISLVSNDEKLKMKSMFETRLLIGIKKIKTELRKLLQLNKSIDRNKKGG